jgi:hypothetical protein
MTMKKMKKKKKNKKKKKKRTTKWKKKPGQSASYSRLKRKQKVAGQNQAA